jgi:hypothetical protein
MVRSEGENFGIHVGEFDTLALGHGIGRANNPMAPNPQNINSRLSGAMAHTGNKANTIPSAQNLDTVSRFRMGISVNF